MSLPWIKVYGNLFEHPRSLDLCDELGDKRAWSHLISLWAWCAEYAPDGVVLARSSDRAIERAARWDGDTGRFVSAAISTGWLVRDGESIRVCGWDDYQRAHLEKAEKDRARLAATRVARKSSKGSATVARQSSDGSGSVAGERRERVRGEKKELPLDFASGGVQEMTESDKRAETASPDLFDLLMGEDTNQGEKTQPEAKAPARKQRARNEEMDLVMSAYISSFGLPEAVESRPWSKAEVAQYQISRKRWEPKQIADAIKQLSADPFHRKQPLHALLTPGKLETAMRAAVPVFPLTRPSPLDNRPRPPPVESLPKLPEKTPEAEAAMRAAIAGMTWGRRTSD